MKRRLLFSIIPVALSVSCVNQEYDISKIEIGDVSGLEGITVPVGSSRQLMLSEILAIEENSEFISLMRTETIMPLSAILKHSTGP